MSEAMRLPETGDGMTLAVTSRDALAEDIIGLTLASPSSEELPVWAPGAHIELIFEGDDGGVLIRHYSLIGNPMDRTHYAIAVLSVSDGRGGSKMIHQRFQIGMTIRARGPHNHFPLLDADHYLFVAGGIGVTPLISMLAEVVRRRSSHQFVYMARQHDRLVLLERLRQIENQTDGESKQIKVWCSQEKGRLNLKDMVNNVLPGTHVYACGPEEMLSTLESLHSKESPWHLHLERFSAANVENQSDGAFEVEIASTGESFMVPPDRSILSILMENGLARDWSCTEGVCGTCETGVLEGVPDHRDVVLTDEERGSGKSMMVCVSRALSRRIVLDL